MSTNVSMIEKNRVSRGSAPNSTINSPKNRAKFLCSHGGKILPHPTDAKLKYIGGETRVISVPRDIPFQELMTKLTYQIDGEMILKCQAVCEDLDTLVTVKCDEDVRYMLDEIQHYHPDQKLRAFLFPASNLLVMDNPKQHQHQRPRQQRYIDIINGIVLFPSFTNIKTHLNRMNNMQKGSFVSSSACSSPISPDSCTIEPVLRNTRFGMHRVHSSPSLCSSSGTLNVPQIPSQYNYRQSSCRPPVDLQKSVVPEKLISVRSVGRSEGVIKYQHNTTVPHYHNLASRHHNHATEICTKCRSMLAK